MRKFFGWMTAAFFGFMAIGAVTEHIYIPAILMLITALLAVPNVQIHDLLERVRIRGRAKLGLIIVIGLTSIMSFGDQLSKNPEYAKREEARKKAESEQATASAAEAEAKKAQTAAQLKVNMTAFYRAIMAEAKSCDQANQSVSKILETGNIYASYDAAKQGAAICQDSWSNIRKLDEPKGLSSDQETKIAKAKETCGNAYLFRSTSLDKLMDALDGGMKPSQVQAFKENAQTAQYGVLGCVTELMTAADSVGLKFDDLK